MVSKNRNKKIKVLLIGTGDLRNYGCEAIVYGTYKMIKNQWPECELHIGSDNIEYDVKIFGEFKDIHFLQYKDRFALRRLLYGILRRIGIGKGSSVRMKIRIVDKYDIYMSAGGDNYAEATNGKLLYILKDLMRIGDRAVKKQILYILWAVSVGPFSKKNEEYVFKNIAKANMILSRESESYKYMKDSGIDEKTNTLIADPAFYMDANYNVPALYRGKSEKIIGINISLLSVQHVYDNEKKGIHAVFDSLDYTLKNNHDYRYVCIPHVKTNPGGPQDDESFMKLYYEYTSHKERVKNIPFGYGARKTKAIIAQCDVLLAARMHCCISGVSAGTPTIFLVYSRKGSGMAKYVYGDTSMSLQISSINGKLLNSKLQSVVHNLDQRRKYLKEQKTRFKVDSEKAIIKLKNYYYNR